MANFTMNNALMKSVLDRFVGIDARRKLPVFADQTFESWFNSRTSGIRHPQSGISGKVVLFHDTFLNYNYPDIGKATTQLLEAAGYEVRISNRKCCGRPMISKGLPEEARANAKYNVQQLHSWVEKGYSIVGCEPSCILTFRDEYPDLLKGDDVMAVAKSSFLLEEFIVREKKEGRWR